MVKDEVRESIITSGVNHLQGQLQVLSLSSCHCITKTPAPEHHHEHCAYRLLAGFKEQLSAIQKIRKNKDATE